MKLISILKPLVNRIPALASFYRYRRDLKILNSEVKFREIWVYFSGKPTIVDNID